MGAGHGVVGPWRGRRAVVRPARITGTEAEDLRPAAERVGVGGGPVKVTGEQFRSREVLDVGQLHRAQLVGDAVGGEVTEPGFAELCHAPCGGLVRGAEFRCPRRWRFEAVVEHHRYGRGVPGHETQRGADGVPRQVRRAPGPAEESRPGAVQSGRVQRRGEGVTFEVDRGEDQRRWDGHPGRCHPLPLPLLGVRVIDLEHRQAGTGVAADEGVQAGAEEHHLSGAGGHGGGERVRGEAAAGGDEPDAVPGDRVVGQRRQLVGTEAEDLRRQRVGEDPLGIGLVAGTGVCHPQRGPARPTGFPMASWCCLERPGQGPHYFQGGAGPCGSLDQRAGLSHQVSPLRGPGLAHGGAAPAPRSSGAAAHGKGEHGTCRSR